MFAYTFVSVAVPEAARDEATGEMSTLQVPEVIVTTDLPADVVCQEDEGRENCFEAEDFKTIMKEVVVWAVISFYFTLGWGKGGPNKQFLKLNRTQQASMKNLSYFP